MIGIKTSFGDLDVSGGALGCVTPWCEWTSDMKSNPLSDVWIPYGREDEVCASLLSMQLQAVPTWTTTTATTAARTQSSHCSRHHHHHQHRADEYAVSVPLDRVESVDMEEGEQQEGGGVRLGMFRVRVCSSQKLFDEIMLRGVLSSTYSVRMFSTSHAHLVKTHPLLLSRVSRGIPRVFMVHSGREHTSSDRKFQISLSNDCMINSIVTSSDCQQQHTRPLTVRPTMRPYALFGLRDRIVDEIAAGMAKVIRVRHVRLPRSVLNNIADLVMPRLFHNHGWVDTARITSTTMTIRESDTAIVLNGNGFPAFAIMHR
jgi:hypothetical protein